MGYVTFNACAAKVERRRSDFNHDRRCGRFIRSRAPHGRRVKSVASQAHELLLTAQPEHDNENLIEAARISETEFSALQKQTLLAIRKLRQAIEYGAAADEREHLLLKAISAAEAWAATPAE